MKKIIIITSIFLIILFIFTGLIILYQLNNKFIDEVKIEKGILLDVPFIRQFPPGTGWSKTKNCGQTSYLMVSCYFNKKQPKIEDIKSIDDWLYKNLKKEINEYNGSATYLTDIKELACKYGGFKAEYKRFYNYKKIVNNIKKNNPIIVSVYYPSPGNPKTKIFHAFVIVGIDNEYVYINDPGRNNGKNIKYSIKEFTKYWSVCLREVLLIKPK